MEEPVAIREAIERLQGRVERRDDYGKLLAGGSVIREVEEIDDPDKWRAAIRRNARADRIKVRTGEDKGIVWAMLQGEASKAHTEETRRYMEFLELVVPRAVAHRHEPLVMLRDGDEALFCCQRCEAPGYVDTSRGPLIGGTLFEDDCPYEEPPANTALTWFRVRPGPATRAAWANHMLGCGNTIDAM